MADTFCDLSKGKCKPCEGGIPPLTGDEIAALMPKLASDWQVADGKLRRELQVCRPLHHHDLRQRRGLGLAPAGPPPDLAVGYNTCRVEYITHAIDGLSESDFICAAKIDALFQL